MNQSYLKLDHADLCWFCQLMWAWVTVLLAPHPVCLYGALVISPKHPSTCQNVSQSCTQTTSDLCIVNFTINNHIHLSQASNNADYVLVIWESIHTLQITHFITTASTLNATNKLHLSCNVCIYWNWLHAIRRYNLCVTKGTIGNHPREWCMWSDLVDVRTGEWAFVEGQVILGLVLIQNRTAHWHHSWGVPLLLSPPFD